MAAGDYGAGLYGSGLFGTVGGYGSGIYGAGIYEGASSSHVQMLWGLPRGQPRKRRRKRVEEVTFSFVGGAEKTFSVLVDDPTADPYEDDAATQRVADNALQEEELLLLLS